MVATGVSSPVSAEEFAAFLSGLVMRSIRIVRCEAEVASRPATDDSQALLEFGEDAELVTCEDRIAVVHATYGVRLIVLGADGVPEGQPAAELTVTYRVEYDVESPMTEDIFAEFRKVTLRLHTIPFAREWIRETSARMGIRPILLPLALSHPAAVPHRPAPGSGSPTRGKRVRASRRPAVD
ncbi:MAG: hypothetical protein AMXMBFR61_03130 [Fimbriimonadales bacterium]